VIELYKAYVADLGNIGSRYATANSFYMTVVTALLGVLALAESSKPFADMRVEIIVCVSIAGIILCWIWGKTIEFFGQLFAAKFQVVRWMENRLHLGYQPFVAERAVLDAMNVEWLLQNERRVPMLLAVLFGVLIVLAIGLKAAAAAKLIAI